MSIPQTEIAWAAGFFDGEGTTNAFKASFMEDLGDMLNGMDAVDEADAWMDPIFKEAHRLWPRKAQGE